MFDRTVLAWKGDQERRWRSPKGRRSELNLQPLGQGLKHGGSALPGDLLCAPSNEDVFLLMKPFGVCSLIFIGTKGKHGSVRIGTDRRNLNQNWWSLNIQYCQATSTADPGIWTQSFLPAHNFLTDTGTPLLALLSCPPSPRKFHHLFPGSVKPPISSTDPLISLSQAVSPKEQFVSNVVKGDFYINSAEVYSGQVANLITGRRLRTWLGTKDAQLWLINLYKEH